MDAIRAVIFDWGGVLIDDPAPALAARCAAALGVDLTNYQRAHARHEPLFQTGQISERTFWEHMCATLNVAPPTAVSLWREAFFAAYKPRPAMWGLVHTLKREGLKTALLSNTEAVSLTRLSTEDRGLFDAIIASCEVGCCKPQHKIYRIALRRLEVAAVEAVFIDDRESYVGGAEEVGINAILYRDTPSLIAELRRRGLPI